MNMTLPETRRGNLDKAGLFSEFLCGPAADIPHAGLETAHELVDAAGIDAALDERRAVTVDEYEMMERTRDASIEQPDFTPDFSILDNWYDTYYATRPRLVLKAVRDYYRTYEWSA